MGEFVEEVEVSGHIIDSLLLPKILDCVTAAGGSFRIKKIAVGQARTDPSHALVEVSADTEEQLRQIIANITTHGAVPTHNEDCRLEAADIEGAFPEGFYATSNQQSEVRVNGKWIPIELQEMDCGVVVEGDSARCIPMTDVRVNDQIVVGHRGVRVFPESRTATEGQFEFMNSAVSTEKPKGAMIRKIASVLHDAKKSSGKTLIVGGPAIVHTGSSEQLCWLIQNGYFDLLFAGNALATHDIEQAMFGTSLGVNVKRGDLIEHGHEHHLRAINRVRRAGNIKAAVDSGLIKSGIMHACVQQNVDYLLAGSIRDDGPLPDVITDALEAQQQMREKARNVTFCLMVATTLHSIAVGNLLPAKVEVVCVDINPSTVIKLQDRGSFQTVGLVTDVAPFMQQLVNELERLN